MKQTQLAPGVRLTVLPAEKFCKSRITLDFIYPASRKTATADALLALVLERGYAACPDMTQLSKKLAGLYGASLSVDTAVNGEMRVLRVTVTGLQDAFALHGEALGAACVDIALGTAFTPVMENGVISPQFVAIEKQQLRQQLEGERNDKRMYCLRQARRRFFGTSRAGIEAYGYLEEVDGLCAEDVTQAFSTMLREAQIDVYLQGVDEHMAAEKLCAALGGVQRAPRRFCLRAPCRMWASSAFPSRWTPCRASCAFCSRRARRCRRRSFPPCVWRWRCWAAPPRRACL